MAILSDSQIRAQRSTGAIGAYLAPVFLVALASAAYLFPRPVTGWLGLTPTPPQVPDDMDNIVRLLAVAVGFVGLLLFVVVLLARASRRARTPTVTAASR